VIVVESKVLPCEKSESVQRTRRPLVKPQKSVGGCRSRRGQLSDLNQPLPSDSNLCAPASSPSLASSSSSRSSIQDVWDDDLPRPAVSAKKLLRQLNSDQKPQAPSTMSSFPTTAASWSPALSTPVSTPVESRSSNTTSPLNAPSKADKKAVNVKTRTDSVSRSLRLRRSNNLEKRPGFTPLSQPQSPSNRNHDLDTQLAESTIASPSVPSPSPPSIRSSSSSKVVASPPLSRPLSLCPSPTSLLCSASSRLAQMARPQHGSLLSPLKPAVRVVSRPDLGLSKLHSSSSSLASSLVSSIDAIASPSSSVSSLPSVSSSALSSAVDDATRRFIINYIEQAQQQPEAEEDIGQGEEKQGKEGRRESKHQEACLDKRATSHSATPGNDGAALNPPYHADVSSFSWQPSVTLLSPSNQESCCSMDLLSSLLTSSSSEILPSPSSFLASSSECSRGVEWKRVVQSRPSSAIAMLQVASFSMS